MSPLTSSISNYAEYTSSISNYAEYTFSISNYAEHTFTFSNVLMIFICFIFSFFMNFLIEFANDSTHLTRSSKTFRYLCEPLIIYIEAALRKYYVEYLSCKVLQNAQRNTCYGDLFFSKVSAMEDCNFSFGIFLWVDFAQFFRTVFL